MPLPPKRQPKVDGLALVIAGVALSIITAFLGAWVVMILLGVLASLTGWGCAIGFWPTVLIVLIVGILTNRGRSS